MLSGGAHSLVKCCLKNGDVPKSPLFAAWQFWCHRLAKILEIRCVTRAPSTSAFRASQINHQGGTQYESTEHLCFTHSWAFLAVLLAGTHHLWAQSDPA